MGPIEDGGNHRGTNSKMNKLGVVLSTKATDQLEYEFSSDGASEADGDDDLLYLADTIPIDDTCPLEKAYESQVMDLDAETQVIDLAGETQVLDDPVGMNKTLIEFNADVDDVILGVNDVAEVGLDLSDGNIDMPEFLSSENCLAGLSYIDSEEPGELSIARALEVVDRFLDLNYMELDGSSRPGVHLPGGPQMISVSKGSRELAQRSVLKSTVGGCGIYDWDYTHEDASGEEFFARRKELWFDEGIPKRRSITEPGKRRFSRLGRKAKSSDQKDQDDTKSNLRDPLYSDSRSMRHKLRVRGKTVCYGEEDCVKDLNKDFDELSNVTSQPKLAENDTLLSACATPADCTTKANNASPVCIGDEYSRQSCRKKLLAREVNLLSCAPLWPRGMKDSRKRQRDIADIRVLFSQNLDDNIVKQQKKILARLGGGIASSMSDATHFVADEFIRTRNMLEAIAFGKPVVTQLWLESCRQASCLIDETDYILRDARKEKDYGFSLPVSLSRACQHPLLEGRKVLITPNTKPGKDVLTNLVKVVHGLAVERLKDKKLSHDLLILSCEEDYDLCEPFLEKGAGVYSSELLLNGIVKQKLEYERHRLFTDNVKRTRSTLWVKKKGQYLRVGKSI